MAIYRSELDKRVMAFFEGMANQGMSVSKYINSYKIERHGDGTTTLTFTMPLNEAMAKALWATKELEQ